MRLVVVVLIGSFMAHSAIFCMQEDKKTTKDESHLMHNEAATKIAKDAEYQNNPERQALARALRRGKLREDSPCACSCYYVVVAGLGMLVAQHCIQYYLESLT